MTIPKTNYDSWAADYVRGQVSLPKPVIPAPFSESGVNPGDVDSTGVADRAFAESVRDQEGTSMPMPGAAWAARQPNVFTTPPQDRSVRLDVDSESEDSEAGASEPDSSPMSEAQYEPSPEDPTAEFAGLDDEAEEVP